MAILPEFPSYPIPLVEGYGDTPDADVLTSPVERGMPKMRVVSKRVKVSVEVTYAFSTRADSLLFDNWYYDTIKRVGRFTWVDCRTGVTRVVNLKGGAIGTLTPGNGQFEYGRRTITLEYLR